jgi:hypothetical protein
MSFCNSSFWGKQCVVSHRMAALLQVIHVAVRYLTDMEGVQSKTLDQNLVDKMRAEVKRINPNAFIVGEQVIRYTKNMVDYFNKNKLVLCQFDIMANESCEEYFERIYRKAIDKSNGEFITNSDNEVITAQELNAIKLILKNDHCLVYPTIIGKGNILAPVIEKAMYHLEKIGLGQIESRKSGNHKYTTYFAKVKVDQIVNSPTLTNWIIALGMDLNDTLKIMLQAEKDNPYYGEEKLEKKRSQEDNWDADTTSPRKKIKYNGSKTSGSASKKPPLPRKVSPKQKPTASPPITKSNSI